ncbi:sugar isomerase domain-containing protein [Geomicrobium sp. JSM 1781026]|uniref:sugar isomerase domain-containing protein n=1 Tax=Geomicrobium sp. JSM 1781026 TaxID=3344580 RepID=UPI0035C12BBA
MMLTSQYYTKVNEILTLILETEETAIREAAQAVADQVTEDKVFYVYGPGGHSNLAAQEIFFRAGGLMHASAILDEGTLLSSGALRSMAIERTPGYGRIVMENERLQTGDLLIIVNAYGINAATIDAALYAREKGIKTIGVSSIDHEKGTPATHPARHPSERNLHELVDYHVDSKVQVGDAVIGIAGQDQKVGAMSTFANAFILNAMMIEATGILSSKGIQPPIWKSGNAEGGDEWNAQFIERFKKEIHHL